MVKISYSSKTLIYLTTISLLLFIPLITHAQVAQNKPNNLSFSTLSASAMTPPNYVKGEILIRTKVELSVKQAIKASGKNLDQAEITINELETTDSSSRSLVSFLQQQRITKVDKIFKGHSNPQKNLTQINSSLLAQSGKQQKFLESDLSRTYKISFDKDIPVSSKVRQLQSHPLIEYAHPNYLYTPAILSNDPFIRDTPENRTDTQKLQWNPPFDYQWSLKQIKVPEAWDLQTGAPEITIAIIDTGFDFDASFLHKDFEGVQILKGYDFYENDSEPQDSNGHGTAVASIIGAKTNNQVGLAGILWETKLLVIKALGPNGGDSSTVANSIIYAADHGANIINMSFGTYTDTADESLRLAVAYAYDHHIVMVAAAGNDNRDIANVAPASYEQVIAVSATDQSDHIAPYSNYGEQIDLSAPGGNSVSVSDGGTIPLIAAQNCTHPACESEAFWDSLSLAGNPPEDSLKYWRANGTSFATPHVAAVAGLVIAQEPTLITSPDKVRNILLNTADDLGPPGFDTRFGYGRLNAFRALSEIKHTEPPLKVAINSPRNNQLVASKGKLTIRGTVIGPEPLTYQIQYTSATSPTTWHETGISGNSRVDNNILGIWEIPGLSAGNYLLKLTVTTNNYSNSTSQPFQIDSDLKPNWPITIPLQPGDAEHCSRPIVGDINGDLLKEIIIHCQDILTATGESRSQLYAFNPSGTSLPGWPKQISSLSDHVIYVSAEPILADISPSPGLEIIIPGETLINDSHQRGILALDGQGESVWPFGALPVGNKQSLEYGAVADDLNQDGQPEIIFLDSIALSGVDQKLYAWDAQGNNLTGFPVIIPKFDSLTNSFHSPQVADLNGDGLKDIVLYSISFDHTISSNKYYFYAYNAAGQKLNDSGWPVIIDMGIYANLNFVLGDLDNNQKAELIIAAGKLDRTDPTHPQPIITIHVFNSEGQYLSNWPKQFKDVEIPFTDLLLADINNDKLPEILVQDLSGNWIVLDKNGQRLVGLPPFPQRLDYPYSASNVIADIGKNQLQDIISFGTIGRSQGASKGFTILEYHAEGVTQHPGYPKLLGPPTSKDTPILTDLELDRHGEVITTYRNSSRIELYVFNLDSEIDSLEWPQYLHDERHTGAWSPPNLKGDFNDDGNINVFDIQILLQTWGQKKPHSIIDLSSDHLVNSLDYLEWLQL